MKKLTMRPSPAAALLVALLALVVALSTPAQAAIQRIAAGTVGTAQLKDGAVTTPKLRDGAVTGRKIAGSAVTGPKIAGNAVSGSKVANGSIGLSDLSAAATPKLPRSLSAPDVNNATGLSSQDWITITERDLPRGRWYVVAKGIISLTDGFATCDLFVDETRVDLASMSSTGYRDDNFSMTATVTLAATQSVGVRCYGGPNSSVSWVALDAVEVR